MKAVNEEVFCQEVHVTSKYRVTRNSEVQAVLVGIPPSLSDTSTKLRKSSPMVTLDTSIFP